MTGQAGKVARGLRTIGANITQLAQNAKEFDITVNGATKTIQLWNETGTDMLNTYDVLKQISAEWDNMTNAEKSSLAIDLAKKTQMDTFLAVLGNFEDAEKAYTTALLSEGSAWKENEKYMESIEAHQAKLKQAWEQLVLSKPIEDLEKALLNAGTALIQFANSGIGQTIIKVTALLGVMKALQVVLQGGSGFAVFINLLGQVIAGETTLTAVTSFLTTTLLANPLFWGAAAVLGITAIVKGVDALIVSFEEATEALEEVNQALSEQENQIKSLNNTISNLKEQLEEVNDKKLEITDPNQLQALERESKELTRQEALAKSQLAIEQKKLEILQQEALTKADEVRNKNQSYNVYDADKYVNGEEGALEVKNGDIVSALTSQMGNIDSLNSKIADLTTKLDALKAQGQGTSDEALEYAENIQELNELLLEEERAANSNAEALLNVQKANGSLTKSEQEVLDLYTQTSQATEQLGQSTKLTEDDINDFVETWGNTEDAVDGTTEAFEKAVKPLSDIENNYSLLSKAVQEFNEKGGLSANTVKKLSELDEKWVSLLELKNGKLTLSKDAVNALAQAEQQDAIASLQAQAAQDMHNVALGNLEALSPIAKSAIAEVTQATQEEANAATQAAAANFLEAESLKAKEEAAKGGHYNGNTQDAFNMINAIMSKYQGMIDNMNSWTLDFGDTSSSTARSTKDAWVEAFKEEQRQLKHSLEMGEITELEYYERLKDLNEKYFGEISGNHQKYIKEYQENEEEIYKGTKAVYSKVKDYLREAVEQGYENAINALKKEEKAVLAEIKSQIEALKKEKKSVLDGIKDQIDALKKQKEQVQKYYNDQIDAIKKENEVLQEQNQLLEYQQQLQQAKAQKVMVMQDGKFQLGENESAVAQAEQNLNNYKDQLSYEQQIKQLEELRDAQVEAIEARIQSLEEYYDYMEDYYDRQIEAMEDYYDRVQEQYEKQIEALQEELDTFKEGYKKAEDLDNARLAAEVMAANEEASVWRARLDNLAEAISEYNRLLSLMGEEGVYATSGFSGGTVSHNAIAEISGVNTALEGFKSRASGDASFASNEVALVGESPNTELVLGSKLNHSLGGGELVHLSKGSGVVNAESTRTLAGLLNGLANPQSVSTSHTTQQTFTFGSISLPNVTNAETFVGALRDKFNNYSIQSTTIKK